MCEVITQILLYMEDLLTMLCDLRRGEAQVQLEPQFVAGTNPGTESLCDILLLLHLRAHVLRKLSTDESLHHFLRRTAFVAEGIRNFHLARNVRGRDFFRDEFVCGGGGRGSKDLDDVFVLCV